MSDGKHIGFYLVLETLLLGVIEAGLFLGWNIDVVQIFMYTAIVINSIVTARHYFGLKQNDRKLPENLVACGLFMTLVADFFMTLIGNPETILPGVILFCIVQMIYALYLGPTVKTVLLRIVLFAACLICFKLAGSLNMFSAFGLLDLSLLLVNAIQAWTQAKTKTPLLFKIGITLFFCCDLAISFRSLTSGSVSAFINLFVWVFYIPSQVAITLSYVQGAEPDAEQREF